jgi:hypothetical protein
MKVGVWVLSFVIFFGFVSASLDVALSDQGTGVRLKSDGKLLNFGDLMVSVYDNLTGGNLIYSETFTNKIINGSWNIMIGENSSNPLSLDYGVKYYRDYEINGEDVDFTDYRGVVIERQFFYSPFGDIGGSCNYFNKTSSTYTGSLSSGGYVGYKAGNYICNQEFLGTHLCTQGEIILTIYAKNISKLDQWSGNAWIATGGAKYSPAALPVNDCNGFTHGVTGNYLGAFWMFNQNDGGVGGVGHCANDLPLACCKSW